MPGDNELYRPASGLVTLNDFHRVHSANLHKEIIRYSDSFVEHHASSLKGYISRWVKNPVHQWSRRYEYYYSAYNLFEFLRGQAYPLSVLDAGSGVTFFPYFLTQHESAPTVTCCDSDSTLSAVFESINADQPSNLSFVRSNICALPFSDRTFDAVYCISVLEHTGSYEEAIAELARVLKDDGLLVLTFDISIDGSADIPVDQAYFLLKTLLNYFEDIGSKDHLAELQNTGNSDLLSTKAIAEFDPSLLPWRYPRLVALYKSLRKRRWPRVLFRNLNCYCMTVRKKRQ